MRTLSIIAILAFAYLAEDSIMSDYRRFGDVYSIHVDENMLSQMNEAVNELGIDSIQTQGFNAINVHGIVRAGNTMFQAFCIPLKDRTDEICKLSKDIAQNRVR